MIAAIAVGLAIAVMTWTLVGDRGVFSFDGSLATMLALEMVALLASPGPGPGLQLLGRRGLVALIGTVAMLVAATGFQIAGLAQLSDTPVDWYNVGNSADVIAPILGVALIAVTFPWRDGGRLLAVFAIPFYPFAGYDAFRWLSPGYSPSSFRQAELLYLPAVAIAALIAATAWWSNRRRQMSDRARSGAAG